MVPEGWSIQIFENLVKQTQLGTTKRGAEESNGSTTALIKMGNLTWGGFNLRNVEHLSSKKVEANLFLAPGDFLFNTRNTPDLVGKSAVWKGEYGKATFDNNINRITFNDEIDSEYICYYLTTGKGKSIIRSLPAGSTSVAAIYWKDLKKIRVILPPLPEQKKIARILSTWDQAITATERLLENSQQRKKGLMQQLLTGKKRLVASDAQLTPKKTRTGDIPGDWEYPKIAELCTQITDKNSDDQQYPVLACSKHYGFVDSLSYFKKRVYSEDLTGYRVIPRGCIGFPANHVEEGSIGLQNLYDFGLVSPIYVVARPDPKKVNADYLYAVLKTDHYRQIFSAATNASVDRRGSLRWKEFSQIRIPLPSLAEQNEIAEFLKLATSGIDALETDLELLKQEKRALMQQLLTGKRRVQVEAA